MRLADFVGIDQLMRRQRDHGLRIAGAERPGAVQHVANSTVTLRALTAPSMNSSFS